MFQLLSKTFINWLFSYSESEVNTDGTFQAPNPERNVPAALAYIETEDDVLRMEVYYTYLRTKNAPNEIINAAIEKLKSLCPTFKGSHIREWIYKKHFPNEYSEQ